MLHENTSKSAIFLKYQICQGSEVDVFIFRSDFLGHFIERIPLISDECTK